MLIAYFFLFASLSLLNSSQADDGKYTKTITFYTQTSKDYYDRFTKVIYSEKMWYFDRSDTDKHKYYITNPHVPIEYVGYKYFFNETFMTLDNVDKVCEYRFHDYFDKKLLNTFYRNESKPTSLLFTCTWFQQCNGLECKLDLPRLPYLFVLPLLLLAIYRYVRRLILREKLRTTAARASEVQQPPPYVSPTVSPRDSDQPPSYNSVMSSSRSSLPAPPSYDTVMSGNVQYTYPSVS